MLSKKIQIRLHVKLQKNAVSVLPLHPAHATITHAGASAGKRDFARHTSHIELPTVLLPFTRFPSRYFPFHKKYGTIRHFFHRHMKIWKGNGIFRDFG